MVNQVTCNWALITINHIDNHIVQIGNHMILFRSQPTYVTVSVCPFIRSEQPVTQSNQTKHCHLKRKYNQFKYQTDLSFVVIGTSGIHRWFWSCPVSFSVLKSLWIVLYRAWSLDSEHRVPFEWSPMSLNWAQSSDANQNPSEIAHIDSYPPLSLIKQRYFTLYAIIACYIFTGIY